MTKTRKFLFALLATAAAAGATAAPALADGRDWHGGRDWQHHDRDWHRDRHPVGFHAAPVVVPYDYGYGYAYPAPPVVYAQPSLSFGFSLPIR